MQYNANTNRCAVCNKMNHRYKSDQGFETTEPFSTSEVCEWAVFNMPLNTQNVILKTTCLETTIALVIDNQTQNNQQEIIKIHKKLKKSTPKTKWPHLKTRWSSLDGKPSTSMPSPERLWDHDHNIWTCDLHSQCAFLTIFSLVLTFDLLTSQSNHFIFVPTCT